MWPSSAPRSPPSSSFDASSDPGPRARAATLNERTPPTPQVPGAFDHAAGCSATALLRVPLVAALARAALAATLALVAILVLVPLESTLVPLAGAPVALAGALVPLAALISTLALIAAHAEVIAGRVSSAVDLVVVLIAHAVLDLLRGRVEPLVDLVLVALREVLRLVHCVVEDHVGVLSSSGSSRVREVRPSYDGPRRDTNETSECPAHMNGSGRICRIPRAGDQYWVREYAQKRSGPCWWRGSR